MSDSRDYVSRSDELGNIHISEEVLAAISAAAALEVEGVSSLTNPSKKNIWPSSPPPWDGTALPWRAGPWAAAWPCSMPWITGNSSQG